MSGTFFTYGSHDHPPGEVRVSRFTIDPVRTARNRIRSTRRRLEIEGEICNATSQTDLDAKIDIIQAAYAAENVNAGLRLSNGNYTNHRLDNAASLSGVRVISGPTFFGRGGGDYVTGRSFRVVIEAEYPYASGVDQLLQYREQVSIVGDGGPRYAIRQFANSPPVIHQTAFNTPVTVQQTGLAVGLLDYPAPNPPLSLVGAVLQGSETTIAYDSPVTRGVLGSERDFPVRWSYTFLSIGAQDSARPTPVGS